MAGLTLTRVRELFRMRRDREPGAEEVLEQLLVDHRDDLKAILGRELVPEPNQVGALAVLEVRLNRAVRSKLARRHRSARKVAEVLAMAIVKRTRVVASGYALPVELLTELVELRAFRELVLLRDGRAAAVPRRVVHAILRELRGVEVESVCISDAMHIVYRTRASRGRFKLTLREDITLREHIVVDLDLVAPGTLDSALKEPVDRVRPTLLPAFDRRSA